MGFGAWALGGGDWAFGWGAQDDDDSVAAIHAALDKGINWIDTAAIYGLGHSEEVVARALKGITHRPYVFTKCERVWDDKGQISGNLKRDSLRRELESSLRRLEVETIDLYQIHWPNPEEDIEEGWSTLAQFQKEGKVRWIGVSNFNVAQMKRAHAIAPITSLQPPYSLLRRDVEAEILPYCEANGIGVIVYSPMQAGLLSGGMTAERAQNFPSNDWRSRSPYFQEPQLSRNLRVADLLKTIAARHGNTPADAAIAWVLRLPAVTAAIVGARNPGQIDGIIGGMNFRLSEAEIAEIEAFMQANP
jgi:aryl-alcohol dehydrogenase-like predicted oxidoreductase